MEQTFRAQRREAHQEGSLTALARLWLETIRDVFTTAPREHVAILRQDVGVRPARAAARTGLRRRGDPDARARGERHGRHVRDRQRVHVPTAAGRSSRELMSISNRTARRPARPVVSGSAGLPRRRAPFSPTASATRRGPPRSTLAPASSASPSRWSPTTTSRCSASSRPLGRLIQPNEGRAPRRRAGGRPGARVLAVALCGRSSDRRSDRAAERPAVHHHRRRAAGLRGTEALVRIVGVRAAWMFDTFRDSAADLSPRRSRPAHVHRARSAAARGLARAGARRARRHVRGAGPRLSLDPQGRVAARGARDACAAQSGGGGPFFASRRPA